MLVFEIFLLQIPVIVQFPPIHLALLAIGGATILLLGAFYIRELRRIQRSIQLRERMRR